MQLLFLLVAMLTPQAQGLPSSVAPGPSIQDHPTSTYDPLHLEPGRAIELQDWLALDENRELPLLLYLPKLDASSSSSPLPIVLFSHGLGGTRTGCAYLGEHWAARGYAAVFLQHPGSDDSVWRSEPRAKRMQALKRAASAENSVLRAGDVTRTIDALSRWNTQAGHALEGRLDLTRIGMSGHSFGALTTQWVSGQKGSLGGAELSDKRIDASIAMSPSLPRFGKPEASLREIFVPMMLMTGTQDTAPIGHSDAKARRQVYPALPESIDRYELVLDGGQHSAFTSKQLPGDKHGPNPNHHRVILALSTAFWDAHLRNDPAALAWLRGQAPRSVMQTADSWRFASTTEALLGNKEQK